MLKSLIVIKIGPKILKISGRQGTEQPQAPFWREKITFWAQKSIFGAPKLIFGIKD